MDALPLNVLVVADADEAPLLTRLLAEAGRFEVDRASTRDEALARLAEPWYDVCLVAHARGRAPGLELVRAARARGCLAPMLLVGRGEDPEALEAVRGLGATDYLDRDEVEPRHLHCILRHALRYAQTLAALRQAIRENTQLTAALAAVPDGVLICDAVLPDEPVIFVNPGFERMTGYRYGEVVGRNPRFLQGPETDPAAVAEIRAAVRQRQPVVRRLLNYRKDGRPFWNELRLTPLADDEGRVTHFIGLQRDVGAPGAHVDSDER